MKELKIIGITVVFLLSTLTSCNKDVGGRVDNPDSGVAYLSIEVVMAGQTRASSEDSSTPEENLLHSLYLVTFDEIGDVLSIPGSHAYYSMINADAEADPANPQAVKVSGAAKNLVVIANPGPALIQRLNTLSDGSTLATFNAAIGEIGLEEITSDARGFAMITGGDETGKTATPPDNKIIDPYVDISGKVVTVTGTDAEARTEAEKSANRVPVRLERLAAKLSVGVIEPVADLAVQPFGATFIFEGWTVDGVNTTYFPFAEKTILSTAHTSNLGSYVNNFYTIDPNYNDQSEAHSGLLYGIVDGSSGSYAPVLPWNYEWEDASARIYVTENTMSANAQKYGNVTRLVIKGTYTPSGFSEGADWFRCAGVNYSSFAALQTAYGASNASQRLRNACEDFYDKIVVYYINHSDLGPLSATNFATLTQEELDRVDNGGQVVKNRAGIAY